MAIGTHWVTRSLARPSNERFLRRRSFGPDPVRRRAPTMGAITQPKVGASRLPPGGSRS